MVLTGVTPALDILTLWAAVDMVGMAVVTEGNVDCNSDSFKGSVGRVIAIGTSIRFPAPPRVNQVIMDNKMDMGMDN